MSADAVEVVRLGLEGYMAGQPRLDLTSTEIEIHDYDIPDAAGSYRGHEGYAQWMADWDAAFEATGMEIERIDDLDDRVMAIVNISAIGRSSGIETTRRNAIVYEVEGGLMTKCDYYTTEEEAKAAIAAGADKT